MFPSPMKPICSLIVMRCSIPLYCCIRSARLRLHLALYSFYPLGSPSAAPRPIFLVSARLAFGCTSPYIPCIRSARLRLHLALYSLYPLGSPSAAPRPIFLVSARLAFGCTSPYIPCIRSARLRLHLALQFPMLLGLVLIAIAAASWGTTGATMTLLSREAAASPLLVGWSRLAIAAPVLVLAAAGAARFGARPPARRRWPSLADLPLCAALGLAMAAYQVCYFRAVTLVGVAPAALLAICSAPLLIAVLAALFLG